VTPKRKMTLPRWPMDETIRLLQATNIPVTAESWMRMQFAGNPPTPPFDGELLAELPDWVRSAYGDDNQETANAEL
jgi:hypothetical protein